IERSPDVDFEREFPTRFDYLVYQMFSCCEKWVGSAAHLDYNGVEQANIQHFPEYQAAKTFGGMLRRIIKSSKFRDHQKIYFLEIALRLMRALDQRKLQSYSCLVFNNCIRRHEFTSVDMEIIPELIRIHQQVDHVLMSKDSTFESELAKHS
ncbi:hypothetical protein, partial [Arsukibacterium sp. UBA3155]|uniref:hypothetical protein n=1 Tax=Arsukibacterium sp. UBA3155 TaxID=1946058 RepID=UPI0025BBAF19